MAQLGSRTWAMNWITGAALVGGACVVAGGCGNAGRVDAGPGGQAGGPTASRMQQAIASDRPVMMVDGEAISWSKILPMLVDSPAGESAARLLVVEVMARRDLQARWGVVLEASADREIMQRERQRLVAEIATSQDGGSAANLDSATRALEQAAVERGLGPAAFAQSLLVRGLVREIIQREGLGLAREDAAARQRLIASERKRREGEQVDAALAVFADDAQAQAGLAKVQEMVRSGGATEGLVREAAVEGGATSWLVVRGLSTRDPRMPAGLQQTIDGMVDGEVGGLVPMHGFEPKQLDPTFMPQTGSARITGTAIVYRLRTRSGVRASVSNETIWQELVAQDETTRLEARLDALLRGADVLIYDRDLQRAWERQRGR